MDALNEHTIPFTGLKDGHHDFRFVLDDAFFQATGEEELEGGTVTADVGLEKTTSLLVVSMHVEGPVRTRCDRCNGPLAYTVSGDQRQIFQLHGEGPDDDDELVTLDPGAHSINLTHYLYECVRLAVPIRHTHAPGQCDPEAEQVLARYSVEHEPTPDPRWEALEQLKNKRP